MKETSSRKNKIIGIAGITLSTLLAISFNSLMAFLVSLGERLSPDGHLIENSVYLLKGSIIAAILLLLGISLLFVFNLVQKIPQLLNTYIQLDHVRKFFLTDEACQKKQLPLYVLIISSLSALLLQLYVLAFFQPPQEGALERYTTLLFPLAGIILLFSIFKVRNASYPPNDRKKVVPTLATLVFLLLMIFGEEISWGQQFMGWESTGVFEEYNFQQETNLHNFFNPMFQILYPAVGMGLFLALFFVWFFPQKESTTWFKLFFPHQSLFFIAFIMACSTFYGHSEAFEELLAIFVVLYSIRILMCLTFPSKLLFTPAQPSGS